MQIVIVSDTHSQNEILECLEKKYKDAYAYIHCGDLEDNPRFYPNWLIVKGNNDYYGKFREDFRIRVGSHRIYVTHSHRCTCIENKIWFGWLRNMAVISCAMGIRMSPRSNR